MLLQIGPTIQNKILKQKKLLLRYYNSHICMCMQKIEATSISEKEEEKQIQCVAFAKLLYILYFYRYELFG